jgi:hypothetical protein
VPVEAELPLTMTTWAGRPADRAKPLFGLDDLSENRLCTSVSARAAKSAVNGVHARAARGVGPPVTATDRAHRPGSRADATARVHARPPAVRQTARGGNRVAGLRDGIALRELPDWGWEAAGPGEMKRPPACTGGPCHSVNAQSSRRQPISTLRYRSSPVVNQAANLADYRSRDLPRAMSAATAIATAQDAGHPENEESQKGCSAFRHLVPCQ